MPTDLPERRPPSPSYDIGYLLGGVAVIAVSTGLLLCSLWVLVYVVAHAIKTAWGN